MTPRTRRWRLFGSLMGLLSLAACHPAQTPGGCPDLTGNWELWPAAGQDGPEPALLALALQSMQAQAGRPELAGGGWERVSIRGDADQALTFSLLRPVLAEDERMQQASAYAIATGASPAARQARSHIERIAQQEREQELGPGAAPSPPPLPPIPASMAPPPSREQTWLDVVRADFTLKNGQHYRCKRGQLQSLASPWLTATDGQGPASHWVPPGWQAGALSLSRASPSRLRAELPLRQTHEITIWCGDGCKGIPYWVSHRHLEDAWHASPPLSPQARVRNLAP
jgi:hypothetical protein